MIPADTHPEAHAVQVEIWRNMDFETKFRQVVQLCDEMREVTRCGIRHRHPEYTVEQVKYAEFRMILGDALFKEVYPAQELLPG
jgi:hypothetical protein